MSFRVRVMCLGMMSKARTFDTEEEADSFAAEMRRIPGFVPVVEEVEK